MTSKSKSSRLVVVSNRLPFILRPLEKGKWHLEPGSGGLVSALVPVLRNRGGVWIGWPGTAADESDGLKRALNRAVRQFGYAIKPVSLNAQDIENFYFGFGYDTYTNPAQAFSLIDHAYVPVFTGTVSGRRHGGLLEFDWTYKGLHLYGETVYFKFNSSTSITWLFGTMLHAGVMIQGDRTEGLEAIIRAEFTRIRAGSHFSLYSAILGFNLYFNGNYKYMVNYIAEAPGGTTTTGAYSSRAVKHILYNQIQVRF